MPHRLMFVHPHPDDESIACGGLIAEHLARGDEVHVVTCTGGEEGENQSGIDLGGRDMGDVRRDEMAAAVVALGSPDHHWLGYRDSGMVGEPSNEHADAFHGADLYEAAARLARLLRQVRPDVVVCDDEHGTYGHPDHVKAHRVTARALQMAADEWWQPPGLQGAWQVPKWYVHVLVREDMLEGMRALRAAGLPTPFGDDVPDDPSDLEFGHHRAEVTTAIDVSRRLDVKRAAMAAHASQIGEGSFFLNTPEELSGSFFGTESYVLLQGTPSPGGDGVERDLVAGLPS